MESAAQAQGRSWVLVLLILELSDPIHQLPSMTLFHSFPHTLIPDQTRDSGHFAL
jgi:hypothetical protein